MLIGAQSAQTPSLLAVANPVPGNLPPRRGRGRPPKGQPVGGIMRARTGTGPPPGAPRVPWPNQNKQNRRVATVAEPGAPGYHQNHGW